jgi:hypothetical protein
MKKLLVGIAILSAFVATLYIWDQSNKQEEQHPTINRQAMEPDNFLLEALDSEGQKRHHKRAIKIEKAIQAIWKLEPDVDSINFERLEQTIKKLEMVHRKILRDSITNDELLMALNLALGNLTHVELAVAAKYSESNQPAETRAAIKYAKLHLKNALILQKAGSTEDSLLYKAEIQLLGQIDKLLSREDLSPTEYSKSIDQMIGDIDKVLSRLEDKS